MLTYLMSTLGYIADNQLKPYLILVPTRCEGAPLGLASALLSNIELG